MSVWRRQPRLTSSAARPPGDHVIETRGLTKRFAGVDAVQAIDLVVPRHEIVGFLGPNGAGKTSTIKLLLGLSRPSAGSARIFGLDSVDESLGIRSRTGYLAQDPRFYGHMTARETLEFAARFFFGGPSSGIRARVDETLELVGLADKADRSIKGFSGGERQRLGIAQAQINHPELLILDEPAAALDPVGRRDVLDIMERLRGRTTIFYSTHILDDVERVSDRVVILDRGRLIADQTTAELLQGTGTTWTITLRSNGVAEAAQLQQQPWVDDVTSTVQPGATVLHVQVTDEDAAEALLLPTVLDAATEPVIAFGRQQFTLEDVFLELLKGQTT